MLSLDRGRAEPLAEQQLTQLDVGLVSVDRFSARGTTPRQALKNFQLENRSDAEKALWLEEARLNAIVGSCRRTLPSVRSGIRCYIAFVKAAIGKVGRYFPPKLEWLQAWALAFRCHLTFANYLGYVKTACLIVATDVSVFNHPGVGRAKGSIKRAAQFVPQDVDTSRNSGGNAGLGT